jgi:hypothetical protein
MLVNNRQTVVLIVVLIVVFVAVQDWGCAGILVMRAVYATTLVVNTVNKININIVTLQNVFLHSSIIHAAQFVSTVF